MERSESIVNLAKALSIAQGQIVGAKKDSENPHFRSKYADLASVWDAIREPLSKNGLAVIQLLIPAESGQVGCETVLTHSTGEYIADKAYMPVSKFDPQGCGSAYTYLRRYSLAAICGVAPEDDDANAASSGEGKTEGQKPKPDFAFRQAMDKEKARLGEETYRALIQPYPDCIAAEGLERAGKEAIIKRLRSAVPMPAVPMPQADDIPFGLLDDKSFGEE